MRRKRKKPKQTIKCGYTTALFVYSHAIAGLPTRMTVLGSNPLPRHTQSRPGKEINTGY